MIRTMTVLLIAVMLLTGCGASALGNQVNSMENAAENVINPTPNQPASHTVNDTITREEAEAIALEHAGFTAEEVTGLRTEYEIDDGVARYEVQFRQGRWEYDYEINADTGAIISWDRDDD